MSGSIGRSVSMNIEITFVAISNSYIENDYSSNLSIINLRKVCTYSIRTDELPSQKGHTSNITYRDRPFNAFGIKYGYYYMSKRSTGQTMLSTILCRSDNLISHPPMTEFSAIFGQSMKFNLVKGSMKI